jgi:capsular exopolysaccharide synthesis family protein
VKENDTDHLPEKIALREFPVRATQTRRSRAVREKNEVTLHELWQILRRRKGAFFIVFGIAVAVAITISVISPTRYEGMNRLTVDFESSDSFELQALAQATGVDAETKLQTQVNILQTDALAWDVIRRLRLDQRTEMAPKKFLVGPALCVSGPGQALDGVSPECRRTLLDEFHERLHVRALPKTEIIELHFRSKSRELAATVVNTLADTYVERSFQTKYQGAMRVSSWLSGQLDDVKRNAELAEEKFLAYQKETGIIGSDENHNVLIERLNSTNQQLVTAKTNRIIHEARYRVAMTGDPEALIEIANGSPLQLLHAEETALKNQYAQLSAKFGEAYPRVVQLKAQLDKAAEATRQEVERTRNRIKDEYDASLKSEALLSNEFDKEKLEAYNTNKAAIQVALLKRDVDSSRELYEQLGKKLKEAGILAGLKATNVTVIDPAGIPVDPVEPKPALNLAMGMLLGGLGGLALCFLLENVDTSIATLNDVSDIGSLPSLAIVPRLTDGFAPLKFIPSLKGNGSGHVVALESPESMVADAYRSLRTALLLSDFDNPPKVLLMTSPLPREGKTTTCVNTAVVFAQKQQRVLLVDGDMRRGDVHRLLNLHGNGGLSAALHGDDPSSFYVRHPALPSMTILPAGKRPPKPPDLLDSPRMRELIAMWRQQFDQVIVDAPPVIGLSDAVILSTMADAVVLVVRAQQSRRQDLYHAQEILASVDANIGGAVLNDFDLRQGFYGETPSLYERYFSEKKARSNGTS